MSYLIFTDQKSFMQYFEQGPSPETVALYRKLIAEEDEELGQGFASYDAAKTPDAVTEIADAIIDGIYVRIGLLHALGLDPQSLWDEVQRSNIAKLKHPCERCGGSKMITINDEDDHECPGCEGAGHVYRVRRRGDGKVLKPDGWQPPDLYPLVVAMLSRIATP